MHRVQRQITLIIRQRHHVGRGHGARLGRVGGRGLVGQGQRLGALEQIAVADAAGQPRVRGIGAVGIVVVQPGRHRRRVVHLQLEHRGARPAAGLQRGRHMHARRPADGRQFALHLGKIGHLPFRGGGRFGANARRQRVLRPGHPGAFDHALGHLQHHHAVVDLLFRHADIDRQIARIVVGLFQRGARLLHIGDAPARPQQRIHRLLDGHLRQHRVARDPKLEQIQLRRGAGLRGAKAMPDTHASVSSSTPRPAFIVTFPPHISDMSASNPKGQKSRDEPFQYRVVGMSHTAHEWPRFPLTCRGQVLEPFNSPSKKSLPRRAG